MEHITMKIRCEQLDELLLEGDASSMQAALAHAESCPGCLETLTAWNEISDTAKSMRTTWSSDLLWPRIERALQGQDAREATRGRKVWRAAAAVFLAAAIGGTTWYAMRDTSRDVAFDQKILRVSAIDDVERAEAAHLAAIERLEKIAEPRLENAETALMISYREKLMLLDDAIAECRSGVAGNRQNAHVRKQLLAVYSEKQRTLEQVLREENDGGE